MGYMRIALFSWESLHSISVGGVGNHVTELGAALERKNHEVHIFTRMGQNQVHYEKIYGVHYHRCPFSLNPNFIEEVKEMCRSFVHHFLQTEDHVGHFDIVHAHDWLASNSMIWLKSGKGIGKKAVLTLHSTEYGRCGNHFWGGNSSAIREQERHAAHNADRVITVSNQLKNEVMWMYNVPDWKVSVIYNGVNVHNFDGWVDPGEVKKEYGVGPLDPTVLFVGRMTYQKAPDLLVEAIPHVLRYYPATKFLFVGDGDMKTHLERRTHQIGVAHATRFTGYRYGTELANLYKACDCVCIPSRNEPFGIVILEAWGAGKPVITTINGGPSEFIWHDVTGLKIYDNPDSIAWGIGTLFADFEHARWMGKNGRIAAEKGFSWDSIADKIIDVYNS
jgi:glycosyltransferase involved in cell wall biosynthesis